MPTVFKGCPIQKTSTRMGSCASCTAPRMGSVPQRRSWRGHGRHFGDLHRQQDQRLHQQMLSFEELPEEARIRIAEKVRSLLDSSPFFYGLDPSDRDQLITLVHPVDDSRRARKVPFARTDEFLLLGGVQLSWDYVANQQGLTTARKDVVGEECLVRLNAALVEEAEGSGRSTNLNEVFDVMQQQRLQRDQPSRRKSHNDDSRSQQSRQAHGEDTDSIGFDYSEESTSRDDLEYLYCERWRTLSCSSGADSDDPVRMNDHNVLDTFETESWFQLGVADMLRLARRSPTFKHFFTDRLQRRAVHRLRRMGMTHYLSESEFRYLSQAFDYYRLSDVAVACNNKNELVYGVVCDGKMQITLQHTFEPRRTSPPLRKRSGLTSASAVSGSDGLLKKHSGLTSAAAPETISASYEVSSGDLIGETHVLIDIASSSVKMEVLEEGVVFGLSASAWSIFLHHVASDKTQKLLLDRIELREDPSKIRQAFPSLRRCRDAALKVLLDSIQTELCFASQPMRAEDDSKFYLVSRGTIMLVPYEEEGEDDNELMTDGDDTSGKAGVSIEQDHARLTTGTGATAKALTDARFVKQGELFNRQAALVFHSASSSSSTVPKKRNSDNVMFNQQRWMYKANGSWTNHNGLVGGTVSGGSGLSMTGGGSSLTSGSSSSLTTSSSSATAVLWKVPSQVLRQLFELDPIFAADFEFMTADLSSILKTSPKLNNSNLKRASMGNTSQSNQPAVPPPVTTSASPVSFAAVMNHPIALSHFRRYLVSIHAQENLDFYWTAKYFPNTTQQVIDELTHRWIALNSLPSTLSLESDSGDSKNRYRERIVAILKEYVLNGAPNQININSEIHRRLKTALEDETMQDKYILDAAMEEVYGILSTDSFPRFISAKDDAFNQMVRDVVAGDGENIFRSPQVVQQPQNHQSSQTGKTGPPSPMKMKRSASGSSQAGGSSTPRMSGRKFFLNGSSNEGNNTNKGPSVPPLNFGTL